MIGERIKKAALECATCRTKKVARIFNKDTLK